MSHKLTEEYFKNQTEKVRIKTALTSAIPANVTYFNLILALTELIREWAGIAFEDEVRHYRGKSGGVSD